MPPIDSAVVSASGAATATAATASASASASAVLRNRSGRIQGAAEEATEPSAEQSQQQQQPKQGRRRYKMPYLQAQVVHYKPRVSVLDKELTTVSYHGLVNFCLLLLSATLIRLAIENYMKYGILVSIPGHSVAGRDWVATIIGLACVGVSFFVAYAIELNAVPRSATLTTKEGKRDDDALLVGISAEEKFTIAMHLLNLSFVLVVPSCITYFAIFQPALGTCVMMFACIMFLKLYSLAATNFDLRRAYRLGDTKLSRDPLRFSSITHGRFVVDTSAGKRDNSVAVNSTRPARQGSSKDANDVAKAPSDKSENVEKLVKDIIPISTRASFSLNARALDGIDVGGDDRIDAKADALPQPRIIPRPATVTGAADLFKEAASAADSGRSSTTTIHDGGVGSDETAVAPGPSYVKGLGPASNSSDGVASGNSGKSDSKDAAETSPRVGLGHPIDYSVAYPSNVTLKNFGYFWLAPTLCYQPSYPRIEGPIRKSFVAKRLTELVIMCVTMYVIIQQYAAPTLVGSVQAIDSKDAFWLSERVLKLSVISAIIWFLGFYAIFHAGLNALAEVLRFADRAFYLDWWNSVDLGAYWREWNLPIHYFCKRHIMTPLISPPLSLPFNVGVLFTFLVSAIMHELLFGIPTHSLKGTSFLGMMVQIPLIQLTQWLVRWRGPESGLGNAVFWISFCIVGQPLGVVQYYYTWVKNNP